MREFIAPKVDTKHIGEVKLEHAFQIMLQLDKPTISKTPRGERIYQAITGGKISGPKLNGSVYKDGGGEYGLRRSDKVDDLEAHLMIRDETGEWIYLEQFGYRRLTDGYYRVTAYFDAESSGKHAWLNDTVILATGRMAPNQEQLTLTYYAAL